MDINHGLLLDSSSRESYLVEPRRSGLRLSLRPQPPEAYKKKKCFSHLAQAHPARRRCAPTVSVGCSCMESIPTIRANQSRHVKTWIDRMHNTSKHHHLLVLKGVLPSAKTYHVYFKHMESMHTLHASYII